MILFVSLAVLLVAAATLVLLGSHRKGVEEPARQSILSTYRQRQRDLAHERELGLLDEDSFAELSQELEQRLLDDQALQVTRRGGDSLPRWLWGLLALLPLTTLGLYLYFGELSGWQAQSLLERSQQQAQAGQDHSATLAELSALLEEQLQRRDWPRGRYLLAQVELERGNMEAAARQYGRLAEEEPRDAVIQAQAAQTAYLAAGQQLTPEVRERLQQALALDADQPTALGLAGIDAFERGDHAAVQQYWGRLLAQMPADAPAAAAIREGLERARQLEGASGEVTSGEGVAVVVAGPAGEAAQGTLFVFVREPGTPVPLAAARIDRPHFPVRVQLTDAQAMDPSRPLSAAGQLEVVARLSRSGQVQAAEGDLEASSPALTLEQAAEGVRLTLK